MPAKIGINGFGRIGRNVYRIALERPDIEVVAVNDITDAETLAHLLKYDSVHGVLGEDVKAVHNELLVGSKRTKVFGERDPGRLPWKDLGVEVVIEATGFFTAAEKASAHIQSGGAKKVIISAPAKGEDLTLCLGVNEQRYDPKNHHIISNASCTTNCVAPMAKVLHENFGITKGLMTTIHAYTADQRLQDAPHKDLRRARAAGVSMVPTSTGAAIAVGLVLPELKGLLDGMAIRVPTPNVSIVDLSCELSKQTSVAEVLDAFRAGTKKNPYLSICDEPLVSIDFNGNRFSCSLDAQSTYVIGGNLVKVLGWYDNEMGYSTRVVDLAEFLIKQGI